MTLILSTFAAIFDESDEFLIDWKQERRWHRMTVKFAGNKRMRFRNVDLFNVKREERGMSGWLAKHSEGSPLEYPDLSIWES